MRPLSRPPPDPEWLTFEPNSVPFARINGASFSNSPASVLRGVASTEVGDCPCAGRNQTNIKVAAAAEKNSIPHCNLHHRLKSNDIATLAYWRPIERLQLRGKPNGPPFSFLPRPSRMRVRIVRTIRRAPVRPGAGPRKPRLDVAARPNTTSGVLGLALDRVVFSFRIFWPIDRETVANQPFA